MDPLDILNMLKEKVHIGEVDKDVVEVITENLQECWEIALVNSH
jgi:hypothetical protein